jgi:hypothetical protein
MDYLNYQLMKMTYWKTIKRKLAILKLSKTKSSEIKLLIFILALLAFAFMLFGIVMEMWLVGVANY